MKIKKIIPVLMAGLMFVGGTVPVLASDNHEVGYEEASTGTTRDTVVTYSEDASFIVSIPKNVELASDTKSASYDIEVAGSILGGTQVVVTPVDAVADVDGVNFYMSDTAPIAKDDVVATVVQPETVWSDTDVTYEGTTKSGDISAPGLTAGSWEGTLVFDISLSDVAAE